MASALITSSYTKLPAIMYEEIPPTPIAKPFLVKFNHELALKLGCEMNDEALLVYSGNQLPSHLKSIAMAYAGHQFGYYVPLLGDGRAHLLGEVCDDSHQYWDIQLKGSGRTKFSRMGDGRAPLSSVLREYLVSESMYGLGIATTRSLAVVGSNEQIYREEGLVPLGVLTRTAAGFLRVGSFEFAADQKNPELIKALADYAINRHYPHLFNQEMPYLLFFEAVVDNQARLIADWMGVGFIHGVMNTDNMTITGETIDYGPCAFMDEFNEHCVFSAIDLHGRYAFNQQVYIAHWNLAKLSQALLPLFTKQSTLVLLQEVLDSFAHRFNQYWNKKIRSKLGLIHDDEEAQKLTQRFVSILQQYKPDFTNTFRTLGETIDSLSYQNMLLQQLGNAKEAQEWLKDWLFYQQSNDIQKVKKAMHSVNPAYIPRNHLVEKAIREYIEHQDETLVDALLSVVKAPYQQHKNTEHLQRLPSEDERVYHTFCGT